MAQNAYNEKGQFGQFNEEYFQKFTSNLKDKIKSNKVSKPLVDSGLFVKNLESAYKIIYEKNQNKITIEDIII